MSDEVDRMSPRLGICTTVRNAGPALTSFVRYHLGIGFERIQLFFDDPTDPDFERVEGLPGVRAIRSTPDVADRWRHTRIWKTEGAWTQREVMARQVLNVELALEEFARDGLDWLLHIDADELFCPASGSSVAKIFRALTEQEVDAATFVNREAVVDRFEVGDPFTELVLFKENALNLQEGRGEDGARAELEVLQRISPRLAREWYLAYANGKSAVRVGTAAVPAGVHRFSSPESDEDVTVFGPSILHYPNAGFSAFLSKYRTLGTFDDRWFGEHDIRRAIGPFHTDARDAVNRGTDAAERFFRERVLLSDRELIRALEDRGLVLRLTRPSELLGSVAGST